MLAAAEAFAERGYFGVNLTDVVEDLGLTKGALYFYFDCKDALVTEIVDRHFAAWDELASEVQAGTDDHLEAIVAASRAVADSYRTSAVARAGSRLSSERNLVNVDLPEPFVGWVDWVTKALRAAKRAKQVRPDLDERAVAQMIVAFGYGAQHVSVHLSRRDDLHAQLDLFWKLVLPGLRPAG